MDFAILSSSYSSLLIKRLDYLSFYFAKKNSIGVPMCVSKLHLNLDGFILEFEKVPKHNGIYLLCYQLISIHISNNFQHICQNFYFPIDVLQ